MDNQILQVTLGLLIPFLGTTLGASFVFLLKKQMKGIKNLLFLILKIVCKHQIIKKHQKRSMGKTLI